MKHFLRKPSTQATLKLILATVTLVSIYTSRSIVGTLKLSQHSDSRPEGCQLDIYAKSKEVTKKFETVCIIDSRTGSTLFHTTTSAQAIVNTFPAACRCEADGIIVDHQETDGLTLVRYGQGRALVRAIRYLPELPELHELPEPR